MNSIVKIILGIMAFIFGAAIIVGMCGDTTDSTTQVVVECDGSYSGSIGGLDGQTSIDGCGDQNFTVNDTMASACIQKDSCNSKPLTVKIVKGGEVVAEQTTNAEYGVVTVCE